MEQPLKILILEDSHDDADLILAILKLAGLHFKAKVVSNRNDFIDALGSMAPDVILSDHRLPQFSFTQALQIARKKLPHIPFILVTGTVSDEFAASIIHDGADDYILKSNLNRLPTAIRQAIEKKQTEKSQALLVSIVNSSDDAILSMSLDGIITSWNTGAERLFGYSGTQVIGENVSLLIPPDRLNEEPEIIMKIKQGEFVEHYETQRKKKNGGLIHISLTVSPIKDNQGNIVGASKIARDITVQRDAEQQKQFDQNNLRSLINNTRDLMWSVDKDLKLITFNDSFNEIIKLISGKSPAKGDDILLTQFNKDLANRYNAFYQQALSGETFTVIDYIDTPVEFWSEISFYPIRKGDEVIGTACYSRDITERKKSEETSLRLASIVESSRDAIISLSLKGLIVSWNHAAKILYEYSSEEVLGKPYSVLLHPDHADQFAKNVERVKAGEQSGYFEIEHVLKNGKLVYVSLSISPVKDATGNLMGISTNAHDISKHKMAEVVLKQASAIAKARWLKRVSLELSAGIILSLLMLFLSVFFSLPKTIYDAIGNYQDSIVDDLILMMAFLFLIGIVFSIRRFREANKGGQQVQDALRTLTKELEMRVQERTSDLSKSNEVLLNEIIERKKAQDERDRVITDIVQRNKDLEQFTYIVSHNLRAPVANILGASNRLNDPRLEMEKKDVLGRGIKESVMKLDNVIKDINTILQVKGGVNEIKEKVHFSRLVEDIKISLKNMIEKKNIEIKYDFSEMDEFLTLKSYIYSIFYNLISNSIKYRQENVHSVIEIKSQYVKNKIELIFTDNGMGIDLQKKSGQVFGLYKRFHPNIEGKGIGLFMVKAQVETLGGKIGIRSNVNKGTEFKIEFEI